MDHIFEHYKKTGYLHHAHVIEGAYDEVVSALTLALARHLGIEVKRNPNLTVEYYESLGIDEARSIKEAQTRSGFGGARKIFIIGTVSFTREAQNALLKTLEEPTAGTHFFIILPRVEILLPTLRSRVLIVSSGSILPKDESKVLAEKFLDASLEDRFAMAKNLADAKDRETIHQILDNMERILYTRLVGKKDGSEVFRDIYQAKTYLSDRGSSSKMLLDQLAIIVPALH